MWPGLSIRRVQLHAHALAYAIGVLARALLHASLNFTCALENANISKCWSKNSQNFSKFFYFRSTYCKNIYKPQIRAEQIYFSNKIINKLSSINHKVFFHCCPKMAKNGEIYIIGNFGNISWIWIVLNARLKLFCTWTQSPSQNNSVKAWMDGQISVSKESIKCGYIFNI